MTAPSKAKPATPKPAGVLDRQRRRSPHAENVLQDELFAENRVGSERVCCWVPEGQIGSYRGLRMSPYQIAAPEDVEEIDAFTIYPQEKDFGVFNKVVDVNNRVVAGSPPSVLMWTTRANREARQEWLSEQSASLKPTKGAASSERSSETIMTLDELHGKGR